MYLAIMLLLMFVLPLGSVVAEAHSSADANLVFLIGKWFVFWGVGLRLFVASLKQIVNPAFTAETIFGLTDHKAESLVQEIGFGNLSIGMLGVLSLFEPQWLVPAAITGCLFFGFAGLKHLLERGRNRSRNIAMISDLWLSLVLAFYLSAAFFQNAR
ncbi:fumarate reductase subunit D [Rhizobium mesoamericanum]|uniref:DUF6790 family protein n=1 Tax=Rhizobium mesoamericanum TaxID=1079800 RepID=UPI00277E32F3|nr:DUF6790 family protein [Rhizobium mesoamericanum]MDQ0559461.1 fumarate reductase subunit D [Rhizobium mesoamericanum]